MATAVKSQTPKQRGGKFRVLVGAHLGRGPQGCECEACLKSAGVNHVYQMRGPKDPPGYDGDVIESEVDLVARHNRGPGSVKFERVEEAAQAQAAMPYEKMSLAQLLAVAAEEEVDLRGASKREDVLRVLVGKK